MEDLIERKKTRWLIGLFVGLALSLNSTMWAANPGNGNSVLKVLQGSNIYGIDSVGNHIWGASDKGLVFYSPDLGKTWELQDTGVTNTLFSVCFVDLNNGWVTGRFGIILKTSDGGKHWTVQQRELAENKGNLFKVFFVNKDIGWAVGELSIICRTDNGGKTWVKQSLGVDKILYGLFFVDTIHGWVAGESGTIASTIDGGKTWTNQVSPEGEKSLFGVYFSDRKRGWVCGIDGVMISTKDGGKTWRLVQSLHTQESLYAIRRGDNKLWVVGKNGLIVYSADDGMTWRNSDKTPLIYNWLGDIAWRGSALVLAGGQGRVLISPDGKGVEWRYIGK